MDVRAVLDGISHVLATGCQWHALPKDLPPRSTVHGHLTPWAWDGTPRRLHHALFVRAREQAGKEAGPTVALIDSQSVKGAEKGPRVDPSGYNAGKKVEGEERHILVDTLGLLPSAAIHPAGVQDRDGAMPLSRAARRLFPFVGVIFADGVHRGETAAAAGTGRWRLEVVRRGEASGFVPLPKRRLVERTFAWLGRCRRLAKDFENLAVDALAFLGLGMIRLMLRRLARAPARS